MNEDGPLAHYEQVADAPDAIARLRCVILDLAVRGKLVPQDAEDEPASELLKRIAKEKARLVKAGEIRKPKELPPVADYQLPFALPFGWQAAPLDRLSPRSLSDGDWIETKDQSAEGGVRLIQLADVGVGEFLNKSARFVTAETENRLNCTRLAVGDVLIARLPNPIGRACIFPDIGQPAITAVDVAILRLDANVSSRFLVLSMNAPPIREQIEAYGKGATRFRVSTGHLKTVHMPLPPLAEQHRIVAKVDELMALCDRLEAARYAREATRDRLTAATLARLNAPDLGTFQDDARFVLDALPALTTRVGQIKQLRQTILNLAVHGILVPQDPKDEPITITLRKAMARRAELVRAKRVRAKKLDSYDDLVSDAKLPSNWMIERLGNLVDPENTISYGVLVPGEEVPDGVPFVRAQDLALSSHPERPNKTISPEIEKAYARTRLRGGEILVCVVGSIGKLGIVPQSWAGANIARAVARILPIPEISREYLVIVMRGEPVQTYFNETTRTLAQPTLNVGLIEQTPIPLPPRAEQQRIVAKVNELMALCDRLEASLTTGNDTRRRLLDAVLAQALDPPAARELEAA